MKTGPLSLQNIYFTDVHVVANPSAKETDLDNVDLEIKPTATPSSDDSRRWTVILSVKITSKNGIIAPYVGQIENIGGFLVSESWPPDQIEKLVYVNASGILYASMREMVCLITGRGFFRSLTLPSCSFMEMYKEREEAKKNELELVSQPPLDLSPSKTN
jgi:preprotein translocase subunit SecB